MTTNMICENVAQNPILLRGIIIETTFSLPLPIKLRKQARKLRNCAKNFKHLVIIFIWTRLEAENYAICCKTVN